MFEHPEAPDRIEFPPSVSAETIRLLTVDHGGDGTRYLRSTPARLAAEQMLEALKELVENEHWMSLMSCHRLQQARAAMAAAQGEKGDTT